MAQVQYSLFMEGDRKMTVLVLGGAGYIGSHTVYALIEKGEDVVIIDNLETGHIEAVHQIGRASCRERV